MEKMLNTKEVMEYLNVSYSTACQKIREVNRELKRKNKNLKIIRGRVPERELREHFGL